ncbi:MAG TPA: hypothetical protein DCG75_11605 [Bacteroidales bacterium]|nr:hypothetical protein [Bacteroidales bacterium]
MLSRKFYINIIIRILFILITCLVFIPFIGNEEKLFTVLSLIVLVVIQIYLLLNYINRFNMEVANFFSALKTNDASFAFHDNIFPYISTKVRNDIEHIRNQLFNITELKEIQQSYFKTVIETAQTGLISIDETGKIELINRCALDLLNINKISHIKALENIHPSLYQIIQNASAGFEKSILIKGKTKAIPLSIKVAEFKQKKTCFKLVSFQNIESELKDKEIESWHKLIRVLTHEINNTVSPITSLASSIEKLYQNSNNKKITKAEVSDSIIDKTYEGLHLISQRGEGLIEFVNNYRNIASLKTMNFSLFKVAELFYNLELLMKNKLDVKSIRFFIDVKPIDLEIKADKKFIEQIFINLIKNSIDSIHTDSGIISLKAFKNEENKIILEIKDNGAGIPEEIIDQIFIPFFTTKKDGSGIGLSLAQQIMRLHGGDISVISTPNIETTFILSF